jgi:hypothetical protein
MIIDKDPTGLRVAQRGELQFQDSTRRTWLVFEHNCPTWNVPNRPCLIFESVGAVRRVFTYPSHWRALDAGSLERLSWKR